MPQWTNTRPISRIGRLLSQTQVHVVLSVSYHGIQCKLSVPLRCLRKQPIDKSSALEIAPAVASSSEEDPLVKSLRKILQRQPGIEALLAKAGEPVTDGLLRRWLTAKGSVSEAATAFLAHARWRISLGRIREASIQNDLATGKVFCQGCDKHGRPVLIVWASRHIIGRSNLDDTKNLIVYTLDTAIATADPLKNKLGQILCLFDLTGLGWANLDAKALQAVFEILQQHYPESLSELWFLNAPLIFWGIWRVVSPFISPATRDKIQFVRGSLRQQKLESDIPPEVLPACYGGQAELVAIDKMAALQRASEDKLHAEARPLLPMERRSQLPGRVALLRRLGGRVVGPPWRFLKVHNPVWAARTVGSTAKRAVLTIPHPWWPKGRTPRVSRVLSMHVQHAWNKRPRPNPRYQPRSSGAATHLAIIDMLAFYVLLALCFVATFAIFAKWLPGQRPEQEHLPPMG